VVLLKGGEIRMTKNDKLQGFPPNLTSLKDAPVGFASRKLRRHLTHALRRVPALPSTPTNGNGAEAFRHLAALTNAVVEHLGARSEPLWEMERSLEKQLVAGELEACGIQVKPKVKSRPQKIPAFYFSEHKRILYRKNAVENFAHRFEGVRVGVAQPEVLPTAIPKKPDPSLPVT
jgi:hypothetical protein